MPVPRSFSLSRREADIAITVERPTEGRLVAAKLVDYSLGLYASRAYAERHGLPQSAAELPRHMLVGYVPDLVASPSLDYAAEFSPAWNARFAISSALGQVEAVRSGAGIGILHAFIARAIPELVPVAAARADPPRLLAGLSRERPADAPRADRGRLHRARRWRRTGRCSCEVRALRAYASDRSSRNEISRRRPSSHRTSFTQRRLSRMVMRPTAFSSGKSRSTSGSR